MLPDFATMCQARLEPPSDPLLAAGVAHHHRADAAFHRLPGFLQLYRDGEARLRRAGLGRGPARGAAHVAVELFLDGQLVADSDRAQAYLDALASASTREIALPGWPALCARLEARGAPHGYRDPARVAEIIGYILRDRPLLALDDDGLQRLRGELPRIGERVAAEADEIMDALARRLRP